MSAEERDPLLDKLHGLPMPTLDVKRGLTTLQAAEAALAPKVRPGLRLPQFALGFALSVTGLMYTVDSVHKLGHIYVSTDVTAQNP